MLSIDDTMVCATHTIHHTVHTVHLSTLFVESIRLSILLRQSINASCRDAASPYHRTACAITPRATDPLVRCGTWHSRWLAGGCLCGRRNALIGGFVCFGAALDRSRATCMRIQPSSRIQVTHPPQPFIIVVLSAALTDFRSRPVSAALQCCNYDCHSQLASRTCTCHPATS